MWICGAVAGVVLGLGHAHAVMAQQPFRLEVDHVYLVVEPTAPEASALRDAGIRLAPDTMIHVGQGTASIVAVFENMYLELMWLTGESDPLEMAQRVAWRETGASPVGIGLRTVDTVGVELPFETEPYTAPWMRPGSSLEVAVNRDGRSTDPSVFVVPHYMALPMLIRQRGLPPPHPVGIARMTGLRIRGPHPGGFSEAVRALHEAGIVEFESGDEHVVELEFDGAARGERLDLRPRLPLVIRY